MRALLPLSMALRSGPGPAARISLALLVGTAGGLLAGTDWDEEARIRIANFSIPDGLEMELFADASQVRNPSAICFDGAGRLYVAEIHRWRAGVEDIRHHPDLLIEDLSIRKTGDRLAMYHAAAERGSIPFETWTTFADRVRIVEDTDGDGRADQSRVFAGGFDDPLDGPGIGLLAGDGGLYYTNIPHLWWLADEDGDGVSESRESLQDGFGVRMSISGHDLHGLIRGPDGRIYWSIGDRGYSIETAEGEMDEAPLRGAVFRCEPDGSDLEVVAEGLRNPQELAFDAYGNLFTCDNDADAWDSGRLVYVLEGSDSGWHSGHQVLLNFHGTLGLHTPLYEDERDGKTRALNSWLVEGLCLPHHEGQPAWILPPIENVGWGPSGLVYNYGATALPESYGGSFFVCNFGGARGDLEAFSVEPAGAGFEVRAREEAWMVGAGNTDVEFGPDGKLYLSCFNNNGWVKQDIGNIYTLYDPARLELPLVRETHRLLTKPFDSLEGAALADLLSHEDLRLRLRAQFELAERGVSSIPLFASALNQTTRRFRRLHGIWGLGQIARATGDDRAEERLLVALSDPDPEVRAQAAKMAGELEHEDAGRALAPLLEDTDARVRCLAALALARCGSEDNVPQMVRLLRQNTDRDPYVRHAAVMGLAALATEEELSGLAAAREVAVRRGGLLALRRRESPALREFLDDDDPELVREAVRAISDRHVARALPDVARLLDTAKRGIGTDPRAWLHQSRLLHANWRHGTEEAARRMLRYAGSASRPVPLRIFALELLESWVPDSLVDPVVGLVRPVPSGDRADVRALLRDSLEDLCWDAEGELLTTVVRLARQVQYRIPVETLRTWVRNPQVATGVRLEALQDLRTRRTGGRQRELLKSLIGDAEARIRGAAVKALLEIDPDLGTESALILLETGEIRDKQQAIEGLGSVKSARARRALLDLLERAVARQGEPGILLELLEAASQRQDLAEAVTRYQDSLDPEDHLEDYRECLEGGDPLKGAELYANHAAGQCNKCHKIGSNGGVAGPDLTGIGKRQDAAYLLESLIDPSAHVVPGYGVTIVSRTDGTKVGGSLLEETADSIRLEVGGTGEVLEIPRGEIAVMNPAVSAMPPMGLLMSKRELRDLVAFLGRQTGKAPAGH